LADISKPRAGVEKSQAFSFRYFIFPTSSATRRIATANGAISVEAEDLAFLIVLEADTITPAAAMHFTGAMLVLKS
jgi:hypothetical protein